MKDLSRLGITFVGAIVGLAVGFAAFVGVQSFGGMKQLMDANSSLWVLTVAVLCVGGLLGGGALALWIQTTVEKKQRKKYFEEKKKTKKGKKK